MEKDAESPLVLIVDDDDDICNVLARRIEPEGCRVVSARSAEEAVALMSDDEPAVALLDIVLPRMNGLQLTAAIRSRWPDCAVIMITGQSSLDTAIEAIHQGAFDYITKPFCPLDGVWAAVQRALEVRKLERDRRALLERRRQLDQEVRSIQARLFVDL